MSTIGDMEHELARRDRDRMRRLGMDDNKKKIVGDSDMSECRQLAIKAENNSRRARTIASEARRSGDADRSRRASEAATAWGNAATDYVSAADYFSRDDDTRGEFVRSRAERWEDEAESFGIAGDAVVADGWRVIARYGQFQVIQNDRGAYLVTTRGYPSGSLPNGRAAEEFGSLSEAMAEARSWAEEYPE